MAEIDVGQLSEAINDKMDRDAHNVESPSAVIIESQMPTAENNYTWYRKYSDSWVEQGSMTTGTESWGTTTVTLPIEMADTNYCLNLTSEGAGFTDTGGASQRGDSKAYFSTKTTTTFLCQKYHTVNWQVSGIMAE